MPLVKMAVIAGWLVFCLTHVYGWGLNATGYFVNGRPSCRLP